jgi:hypothetical protein
MHGTERRDVTVSLFCWLCYSVVVPALAIFLRWLVPFFLYGYVDPLSMLTSSEVVFLAGVIVAETLGEAPGRGVSSQYRRRLVMIRAFLMVLLVLSLMVFGAFTPFEAIDVSTGPLWWVRTPQGQRVLAWFNLGLFLFVFGVVFWTRWQYSLAVQPPTTERTGSRA